MAREIAAIVLAAGGSARFGRAKQLLTVHGENIVQRAVRSALESGVERVIVVLGAFAPSVEMFISPAGNVETLVNDKWQSGQSSSLKLGIERAKSLHADAALVLLADQPEVGSESLRRLILAFDATHRVVASEYAGTVGVPAIFGSEFFDDLGALEGDRGAGAWIRSQLRDVTTVTMPEAALDIDTPWDFERLSRSSTAE